jgi:diaminohydroxyphosphoribosylaminopyrimidine deaminase/5-amino-6-(5-phosphoribosylamino)uracil reductase
MVDAACAPEAQDGDDAHYLREAFHLGLLGAGYTAPNPTVGALVIQDGSEVGRGAHRVCGQEHAEAAALSRAKDAARGATIYSSLEPCTHHGKQPPCADAIIAAGIARVVYGGNDPDERTCCRAKAVLSEAGVEVEGPLMPRAAVRLNDAYCHWKATGEPFVALKLGMSLDGRIALENGESQWITGKVARGYSHFLRQCHDAVLVGMGTVKADNPSLTVRHAALREFAGDEVDYFRFRQPARVVVDPAFELVRSYAPPKGELARPVFSIFNRPEEGECRREVPWLVFAGVAGKAPAGNVLPPGVEILEIPCNERRLDFGELWRRLGELHIHSVLVEGGTRVAQELITQRAFTRFDAVVAPTLLGADSRAYSPRLHLRRLEDALKLSDTLSFPLGRDTLVSGYTTDFIDRVLQGMAGR